MQKSVPWFLLLAIIAYACFERPVFSLTPSIDLKDFYFTATDYELLDSMNIIIEFEDGDGDLGLGADETYYPYQLYDILFNGDSIKIGDSDTLPPYNCLDYEIIRKPYEPGAPVEADTFYVQRNDNYFNYFLDFFIKENGQWRLYDPAIERNCSPRYHGRYFHLNTSGNERPLTGELKYGLTSGFRLLFRYDTLKVRIQIQDRALNRSNYVETEPFLIQDRYR